MRKTTLLLLLVMLASVVCSAQQTTLTPWAKFQFMSGSWNAVGSGTPGEGAGECSFAFVLQNKVHVIRYVAQFSGDGNTCSPVSEPSPPQPRFRLIYQKLKEGQLAIRFDIASPDQPNNFKNYVAGTATLKDAAVPRRQANPAGPVRLTFGFQPWSCSFASVLLFDSLMIFTSPLVVFAAVPVVAFVVLAVGGAMVGFVITGRAPARLCVRPGGRRR